MEKNIAKNTTKKYRENKRKSKRILRKKYYEDKRKSKRIQQRILRKNIIKLKENQKKYQEYKKEYAKAKFLCECGEDICRSNKTNHLKTQKHLALMHSKV